MVAANNRSLDEDSFNELIKGLTGNLQAKLDKNEFDRGAIEELKMATRAGLI